MRNSTQHRFERMDDSDEEELPLMGNEMSLQERSRTVYNKLRHVFLKLPSDLQRIVGGYLIAIHILLLIALVN